MNRADLAVVGFGPVGATVAALGAQRGLDVVVVERDRELYALPRAAHADHEALRIMQAVGCADDIVDGAVPTLGMNFLTAAREVLLEFCAPQTTRSGWPSGIFFHQPTFEVPLRNAAIGHGAQLRSGTTVLDVVERDDHVELALDDATTLEARTVVACDGARSTVRRLLDVELDDLAFDEPWLVVDLVCTHPVSGLPDRALQVCDPARPHTLVPMPWPRFRFEFMLLPGEDPEAMQHDDVVRGLLATWIDPALVEIERAAVYRFHGLLAKQWRHGRVFLAGDAAHQMPPFLGQGMCSGLRDAQNLVWKLDAWLRDGAPDALLDTYQAEREPHVRAIVEAAVGFGRLICTLDPAVAEARDAQMLAARTDPAATPAETPEPSSAFGPGLLVGPGGGAQARQFDLDGARLDDVIGARFAVVTRAPLPDGPLRVWWAPRAALLDVTTRPALAALFDDDTAEAVVVRPDRHLLGAGDLESLTRMARAALDR